jgi:hypothetical protein
MVQECCDAVSVGATCGKHGSVRFGLRVLDEEYR